MTIEEIFSKIASHMIEGIMIHEQLANYYDFLGLKGCKRCHEYHYFCESAEYRKLQRYFINRYNKLIPEADFKNDSVIPSNWYRYTRQEVDSSTKRNAVKSGLAQWIKWEKETRTLYTEMYKTLEDMQEYVSAEMICHLLKKADKEIKQAERKQLELESVDYDLILITSCQHDMHEKYRHKLEKLVICV